ncbi:ATP-binding protein [Saccharothrix syringae]|uniref:ATP-binding protein n=1 Tax=Saccharothrix syringae TaxID=103733 RepID=A0A5Q0H1L5_SACSY|nr:ATP-binding protein [Saccharothrix syringae]QFZ20157.1 ATP-binding protein [Saccharothrix syringae]
MTAGNNNTVVLVVEDDDAGSVADVASWLHGRVDGWPAPDVLLIGVVVGELFDNARRHGSPPYVIELVLDHWHEALVVSVSDRALHGPGPWWPAGGLLLVDALSERWGVESQGRNTTVWAEILFES